MKTEVVTIQGTVIIVITVLERNDRYLTAQRYEVADGIITSCLEARLAADIGIAGINLYVSITVPSLCIHGTGHAEQADYHGEPQKEAAVSERILHCRLFLII